MLHVLAAEGGYQVFDLAGRDTALLVISLAIGIVSLVVAYALMRGVLAADPGSEAQQEIAGFIHEGAMAYIKRQFRTIAFIVVPLAVVVFVTSVALEEARRHGGPRVRHIGWRPHRVLPGRGPVLGLHRVPRHVARHQGQRAHHRRRHP